MTMAIPATYPMAYVVPTLMNFFPKVIFANMNANYSNRYKKYIDLTDDLFTEKPRADIKRLQCLKRSRTLEGGSINGLITSRYSGEPSMNSELIIISSGE